MAEETCLERPLSPIFARSREEAILAPRVRTQHVESAAIRARMCDMLQKFDNVFGAPVNKIPQSQEHDNTSIDNAGKQTAFQPRESLGLRPPMFGKPKRLPRHDIWKPSTTSMDIPGVSPTTKGSDKVLLCASLPEFRDVTLSNSLMEQCRLDDKPDGASPESSEASWISRWWSSTGDSKTTSYTTCKTSNSSVGQVPVTPGSNLVDLAPGRGKRVFYEQKRSHVSALSSMIKKDPDPQPLCEPKHDLWAVIATARKVQPTLSKMSRCSGHGDRKAMSCPTPQIQLNEKDLSPSSASQPRAIPRPRVPYGGSTNECGSIDTSYTSANSGPVTDSSYSSPELVSREERKTILLGRLMDYFFAVLANNHKDCAGYETSSRTALSSRESVAPTSSARGNARRPASSKGKRSATPDEDGSDDEDSGGPRAKKVKTDETEMKRLACPFFKRNPHRYMDQSKCVGPGWMTVHRLKEHLYRRHRLPVHCLRCHDVFLSDEGLEQHSQSQIPCQRRAGVKTLEGITSSQERQLRSRKRSDKTEEEKWRDVYRICFPLRDDEDLTPIPSPYFELPTQAEGGRPGVTSDMARYDEYMNRELPRRVKKALELRIEQELNPVEESLKRQLPDIVRGLYQALSEDFRRSLNANSLDEEERMEQDQDVESTNPTDDGDIKGKGKMVASATPQLLQDASDNMSEYAPSSTPACDERATSQPIDMSRPLQPLFDGTLAGLDSWMCGVGQESRDWSWPDSGYISGMMSVANCAMVVDHNFNTYSDELLVPLAPYTGEAGVYQDRLSIT